MNRNIPLSENEYYHVFNRGVDKRKVFLDHKDYERFLFLLGACNDKLPLLNSTFFYKGLGSLDAFFKNRVRNKLVEVLSFCLMPNHFHLILKQREEKGISRFLQKVSTGYAMYFNNKNERTGALFQGAFKSKHIGDDKYLKTLVRYVHLNPLELEEPNWKENGILDIKRTTSFLKDYPWSSLSDYLGSKKFSLIVDYQVNDEEDDFKQFLSDLNAAPTIEVSPL